MSGIAMGADQVRSAALLTRMFETAVMPWECGNHTPVVVDGLGRTWTACRRCGFILDPDDRELVLRLAQAL